MSEQKYCSNCGWGVNVGTSCKQCGMAYYQERIVTALESIAANIGVPRLGSCEGKWDPEEIRRGYTE